MRRSIFANLPAFLRKDLQKTSPRLAASGGDNCVVPPQCSPPDPLFPAGGMSVGVTILYLYGRFIPRGLAVGLILSPHHHSDMQTHGVSHDAPTFSHNSHSSHKSHNSQPCVNRLYRHTAAAIQNTKTPACTLAHTRRTRARALGAKNAKKSQIFAFFCLKSFDKSILDDILCFVLRLLSSGDNKTG